jgi:tyrosine-protein phosphatase non-receptor type 9
MLYIDIGTFCTLDICLRQLEQEGVVDIRGTVEKIRSQRAHSIQMPDQYVFCYMALLEHAIMNNRLPKNSLDLLHSDHDESEDD